MIFIFILAWLALVTFPFFFFPMDFVQKLMDPNQAFVLHYVGLSLMALVHYRFAQYFKSFPKIYEKIYTILFILNAIVFFGLSFKFNLTLFKINRLFLFGVAFIIAAKIVYLTFKAMRSRVKGRAIFFSLEKHFLF